MRVLEGNILKMRSSLEKSGATVEYSLPVSGEDIKMNDLINEKIKIEYLGRINCIHCGRETKKSFAQGYCYPCFISLPQTDACSLHPEKCEAHRGISRDMSWSEKNCLSTHIVYLALTPGLKVGVTRESQIPTRWIDQGAWETIVLARTDNRYSAGVLEVFLKNHVADKTNWRHMLSGKKAGDVNLVSEKERIISILPGEMLSRVSDDINTLTIDYPVQKYPHKVKSLNIEETKLVEGVLSGIKGQYLIMESGEVLNIRKFGGYFVRITY